MSPADRSPRVAATLIARGSFCLSSLPALLTLFCLFSLTMDLDAQGRPARPRTTGETNRYDVPWSTRSVVYGARGMAATSQPLATQTALEILRAGGSAVDAAIAANALLGLVEPTGNGMGGDLFAIVWDPEGEKLHGLNASGRSPKSLTLEHLQKHVTDDGEIPPFGPLPISVPGAVDGWFELHGRFGKLPMTDVLGPAIRHAREGAPITHVIAFYWRGGRRLAGYPGFAEVFLPGGRSPRAGERFRNPALANTLEVLANEGRDAFYEGSIGETLVAFLKEHGGFLSAEDLAEHTSEWVEPVSTNYRGFDVWELPPNGQGIAALQILNLIEPYDVRSMGFGSPEWMHLFTEAKKIAFEDRAHFYADPQLVDVPVEGLVSKDYARQRGVLLDLEKAGKSYPIGNPALREGDTIYLTVADENGMMVSLIQSNYRGFGSGLTPPTLGFCLQDRGQLFDLTPGRPNTYAPGKRPFHTIIPAFVTKDGKPWMSFGVMGGDMQPQGHVQILVNMIDFDMDLQAAGDAPRMRHDDSSTPTGKKMTDGGTLMVEHGFDPEVLAALRTLGHRVDVRRGGFGGYQAILRQDNNVYAGASEMRKDGHAAGY